MKFVKTPIFYLGGLAIFAAALMTIWYWTFGSDGGMAIAGVASLAMGVATYAFLRIEQFFAKAFADKILGVWVVESFLLISVAIVFFWQIK